MHKQHWDGKAIIHIYTCAFFRSLFLFLSKADASPVASLFQGVTNESLKKSLVRQQPRQLFCTSKRPAYFSCCCQMEAASPSPHNGARHLHYDYFFLLISSSKTLHISFFISFFIFPLYPRWCTSSLSPLIYRLPSIVSVAISSQEQDHRCDCH